MDTLLVILFLTARICGIQLEGDWDIKTAAIVQEAIYDIGYRIDPEEPCLAFMRNFPTVTITLGSENASGGCQYVQSGACVSHRQQINILTLPRAIGNRTEEMANISIRNLIVHELGHVFDWNLKYHLPKKMLSNEGFHPPPPQASMTWRQHPCTSNDYACSRETFADMFLGWVYDKWADDELGHNRAQFMSTYMSSQISACVVYC